MLYTAEWQALIGGEGVMYTLNVTLDTVSRSNTSCHTSVVTIGDVIRLYRINQDSFMFIQMANKRQYVHNCNQILRAHAQREYSHSQSVISVI